MKTLQKGDRAPEFRLQDQNREVVALADFRNAKLLVYFFPKAGTPGCTRQACAVRDALPGLHGTGADVVGISPDSPEDLKQFEEDHDLGFTLLSDRDHKIAEAYGAWGEQTRNGETFTTVIRSAFLVDERGRVEEAWPRIDPDRTVPAVNAALGLA